MTKKIKIALIIGNDVIASAIAQRLIKKFTNNGHSITACYIPNESKMSLSSDSLINSKTDEWKKYKFYESKLISDLSKNLNKDNMPSFLSPRNMCDSYGIHYEEVANINEPSFLKQLQSKKPDITFNIRGTHLFTQDTISTFKTPLVNLHPAILPDIKGLSTPLHAIRLGHNKIGWTLHFIDSCIDTGDIISTNEMTVNKDYSVLGNMMSEKFISNGCKLIEDCVNKFVQFNKINSKPQNFKNGEYFGIPSIKHFEELSQANIKAVEPENEIKRIVELFNKSNINLHNKLASESSLSTNSSNTQILKYILDSIQENRPAGEINTVKSTLLQLRYIS